MLDAVSGNLQVEPGPGEKHGSGVELAVCLLYSGDDLGPDNERGEAAGKVADYLVRVWNGRSNFHDRYAPGRDILRGKDRCLRRVHADGWNQTNFANLLIRISSLVKCLSFHGSESVFTLSGKIGFLDALAFWPGWKFLLSVQKRSSTLPAWADGRWAAPTRRRRSGAGKCSSAGRPSARRR